MLIAVKVFFVGAYVDVFDLDGLDEWMDVALYKIWSVKRRSWSLSCLAGALVYSIDYNLKESGEMG